VVRTPSVIATVAVGQQRAAEVGRGEEGDARATWLILKGRIDELNVEFHPKSAKEELKEELDDFAQRSAGAPDAGAKP
jgi:hypothetical protein